MNQTVMTRTDANVNRFYAKVYSLMGIGVGLSALVSFLMLTIFSNTLVSLMTTANWVYGAVLFLEVILVFCVSLFGMKNTPAAYPLFLTYSAVNGFTMSFLVARFTQTAVFKSFLISAIMFFIMALIGYLIKRDLSGIGRALMAGLIGVIVASVINLFIFSSVLDYFLNLAVVVIFAGLVAWDNQKIRSVYHQSGGDVPRGWAVCLALTLYLDFINLFVGFLRLSKRN